MIARGAAALMAAALLAGCGDMPPPAGRPIQLGFSAAAMRAYLGTPTFAPPPPAFYMQPPVLPRRYRITPPEVVAARVPPVPAAWPDPLPDLHPLPDDPPPACVGWWRLCHVF
jgi:hypothetical protein